MKHPDISRFRRSVEGNRGAVREHKHKFISVRRKLITGIVCAIAVVTMGQCLIDISLQRNRVAAELDKKTVNSVALAADLAAAPLLYNEDDLMYFNGELPDGNGNPTY